MIAWFIKLLAAGHMNSLKNFKILTGILCRDRGLGAHWRLKVRLVQLVQLRNQSAPNIFCTPKINLNKYPFENFLLPIFGGCSPESVPPDPLVLRNTTQPWSRLCTRSF